MVEKRKFLKISRLNTSCTKWDRYKSRYNLDDVIPLWVADMDFECADEILVRLYKRINHGVFGYTDPSEESYESVVSWMKRKQKVDINKQDISFTTGVVYAFYQYIQQFTDSNEKIIIQTPVYPPFFNVPKYLGREVITNPLMVSNGKWEMDFEDFERKCIENPEIRVLILCNPHNPVGRSWNIDELDKLMGLCLKYSIVVLSDEIHADLTLYPKEHTSLLSLNPKYHKNIVVLGSPTKAFNLAGIKVSYAIIKDIEVKSKFDLCSKNSGLSSINIFGYEALNAAYQGSDDWLVTCKNVISDNYLYLKKWLDTNLPLAKFEIPEATYLAWVNLAEYKLPKDFVKDMMNNYGVQVEDGSSFIDGDGYIRVNVACSKELLVEGLERIKDYISRYEG